MKRFFCLTAMAFLLILTSCESMLDIKATEKFVPAGEIPQGKALVYIYRPTVWAALVNYKIYNNGEYIIKLPVNSYFPLVINSGENVFSAKTEIEKKITIDAKPGKTYFLLTSVTPGFFVGHPYFEFVDEKEWTEDLAKYLLKRAEIITGE